MAVILIFYLSYFLAKIRRFYPQFPLRNQKLRELNQLHLKAAAKHIGRSAGWLSEIENNRGNARISQAEFDRIVKVYGGESQKKQFGAWVARAEKTNATGASKICLDGSVLKFLRNKAELTLAEVAKATNLSKTYLSYLENGKKPVSKGLRDRLLGVYGYSPSSFKNFTTKDKRSASIPTRYKLQILLGHLEEEQIQKVLIFANQLTKQEN
jgi:transcriptional regulator with XRE-family HTH domain